MVYYTVEMILKARSNGDDDNEISSSIVVAISFCDCAAVLDW